MTNNTVILFQSGEKVERVELPVSLLPLAGTLLEKGFKVEIIDNRIEDYHDKDFSNALFVGITSFTGSQLKSAMEFAIFVKNTHPNIPIVFGGIHASLTPLQSIKEPFIDIVVKREGEKTLVELAECLKEGKPLNKIEGIVFKENENIIETKNRKFIDLNEIPPNPYHLLKLEKYNIETISLNSSRGCPYNCCFCFNLSYNEKSYRTKSPEKVIEEIKHGIKWQKTNFVAFNDDNFFFDKQRVKRIAELLVEEKLGVSWSGMCRANYIAEWDNKFFQLLVDSRLKNLGIGGESGSQKILNQIHKGITAEMIETAVKRCNEFGIKPIVSFIVGFPNETKKDVIATINLIDRMNKTSPLFETNGIFILTPYPKTDAYKQALDNGFIEPQSMKEWSELTFGNIDFITWFPKKHKVLIKRIQSIAWFLYAKKKKWKWSIRHLPKYFAKNFLIFDAWLRWKLKWFSLAFEWDIYYNATKNKA